MFSVFHCVLHETVLQPHEVLALNEFYPKVIHSLILIATPTHYDLIHSDEVEEGVKRGIIIYHQQDNLKIIIRTAQYKMKKGAHIADDRTRAPVLPVGEACRMQGSTGPVPADASIH
jgi:hypothetical protein